MKQVTLIETLVILAVAVPAFGAITCTERECVETKNVQTNATLRVDALVAQIAQWTKEIDESEGEIRRDIIRYKDEKELANDLRRENIAKNRAQLTRLKNNGANITQDDLDGIITVSQEPQAEPAL